MGIVVRAKLMREIEGLALFFPAVFLFLSLISYSPADPSANTVGTVAGPTANYAGLVGAYLADLLWQAFGISAYLLPTGLTLMAALRLRDQAIQALPLKLAAATALGLCMVTLAGVNLAGVRLYGGRVAIEGALGGYLAHLLTGYFNVLGSNLLLGFLGLLALMVTTEMSLAGTGPVLQRARTWVQSAWHRLHPPRVRVETARRAAVGPVERPASAPRAGRPTPRAPAPPAAREEASAGVKEAHARQEEFAFVEQGGPYRRPPLTLLDDQGSHAAEPDRKALAASAHVLEERLKEFGVEGKVSEVRPGPIVTLYEFEPAPGVKINRIVGLADDLALGLKAAGVRIIAPLPGRAAVGVEVPNEVRETVYLRDLLADRTFQESRGRLPLALGKDIGGHPVVADLAGMPHLLVAGATGAGKSVALSAMVVSLLYRAIPAQMKLLLIDPKVLELSAFEGVPHLLAPVVTEARRAIHALKGAVERMEERYRLMGQLGVRSIEGYNRLMESAGGERLPYLVIVIDELADLMLTSSREVEEAIIRLAQMARASGIHLIVATQRPSVDVITGLIKANFSARIAFQVSSRVDSRTILDALGAEALLGSGDMLFLTPGTSRLQRVHGPFISEGEVKRVAEFLKRQGKPAYDKGLLRPREEEAAGGEGEADDELYARAVELVIRSGTASISLLQRHLRVGYNRAARMIERMEGEGIVGPEKSGRRRDVLVGQEERR
ncbi:MAG: DNA translocase FtsK [Deltaproteobacteria bacterium]|nr:DNA translocase FtsK [Deltaproteobacteria bacterium]